MTDALLDHLAAKPAWAERFAIRVPVLYRCLGQLGWSQGQSENLGRTRMLFRCNSDAAVGAHLDLSFKLTGETGGELGAVMICKAQIGRRVLPPAPGAHIALAARILDCRLMREENEVNA
jgi:hypothetical protein